MTDFNWNELLNKAKAASFDPIPDGNYHIKVHETEAVTASTGKPMIKLKLNVEDGQHANRKLLHQLVLSPDSEIALAIFFNHLKCFGIGPEFLAQCPPGSLAPVAQALLGKHAIAKVGHKEWQGEQRNEIKGYLPMSAGASAGAGAALPGLPGAGQPAASLPGLPGLPGLPAPVPAPVVTSASVPEYGTPDGATALPGLPVSTPELVTKALEKEGFSLTPPEGDDAF